MASAPDTVSALFHHNKPGRMMFVPAMSVYKDSLWQEIKDGKSEWFVAERTPEACDLFEVQVIEPLRQVRDDGRIAIHEKSAPSPGQYRVVYVFVRAILNV
jgi:hypothetical protein